jgi:phage gp37-like protein
MEVNIEQHQAFHDGLGAYFREVQKNPSVYEGQKVRNMIEEFGAVFQTHLKVEIDTLEKPRLKVISPMLQI